MLSSPPHRPPSARSHSVPLTPAFKRFSNDATFREYASSGKFVPNDKRILCASQRYHSSTGASHNVVTHKLREASAIVLLPCLSPWALQATVSMNVTLLHLSRPQACS
jgi:hypothetical protein